MNIYSIVSYRIRHSWNILTITIKRNFLAAKESRRRYPNKIFPAKISITEYEDLRYVSVLIFRYSTNDM
jgi:hypothetical protein